MATGFANWMAQQKAPPAQPQAPAAIAPAAGGGNFSDWLSQQQERQAGPTNWSWSEVPGIIGRTMAQAAGPFLYGGYAAEEAEQGRQPEVSQEQFQAQLPKQERYGGGLGYAQQIAADVSNPLGLAGTALFPEATIGGDIAHEWARQHGYGPMGQEIASALGGGVGGLARGAIRAGTGLVRSMLPAAPAAPSAADEVVSNLARAAGLGPTVGSTVKHEAGQVLQDEVGDKVSEMAAGKAATARAMKARAGKEGPKLVLDDMGTRYLKAIDSAATPSNAMDLATGFPDLYRSLPPKAQTAVGAHLANEAAVNPDTWLGMDPAHQAQVIPNAVQRQTITDAANAAKTARATTPARQPNLLQQAIPLGMHFLRHRAGPGAALTGLGHLAGLDYPTAEVLGGAAGLLHKPSMVAGAAQGYLGGPDNQLQIFP